MSEKRSILDLVDEISQTTGINKNDTEKYIRSLIEQIQSGILQDGQVKVKGLGTFKVQWNEPRKSVDVNTGAETIIPGHNKLSFSVESGIKESLNTVVSRQTSLGSEPQASSTDDTSSDEEQLARLREQANEIGKLLGDLNQKSDEKEIETTSEDSVSSETKQEKDEGTKEDDSNVGDLTQSEYELGERELPIQKKHTTYKIIEWLLIICFIIALIGALFYWERQTHVFSDFLNKEYADIKAWNDNRKMEKAQDEAKEAAKDEMEQLSEQVEQKKETVECSTNDSLSKTNGERWTELREQSYALNNVMKAQKHESERRQEEMKKEEAKRLSMEKKGLLAEEKLSRGVHLTDLALKYYGHKDFWIYIYEANKQTIPNPNNIKVGTIVRIPKMDETVVDAANAKALETAREKIRAIK